MHFRGLFGAEPHHISSPEIHQCCLMGTHQGQFTLQPICTGTEQILPAPSPSSPPPARVLPSLWGRRSPVIINEASSLSERENRGGMGVRGGRRPSSITCLQMDDRCGLIKPPERLLPGTERDSRGKTGIPRVKSLLLLLLLTPLSSLSLPLENTPSRLPAFPVWAPVLQLSLLVGVDWCRGRERRESETKAHSSNICRTA